MSLSLNETYKLVKDASRGAGLSWGEADELAQATVWLEVAGLPGSGCALGVLDEVGEVVAPVAMHSVDGWNIESAETKTVTHSLLAAMGGRDIAMSTVMKTSSFEPVTLTGLHWPLIGLAALSKVAPPSGYQMSVRATDAAEQSTFEAVVRTSGVWFRWCGEQRGENEAQQNHTLVLTRESETAPASNTRCVWSQDLHREAAETGLTPDPHALKMLRRYAHACLVPATEESRLKGAGAGTVDRD